LVKIITIMPVYECGDVVLTALKSIDGKVDEIRCYDGRWVGHDGADYSTDNTEEVILKFAEYSKSKIFYRKLVPAYEWEFHNKIFKDIADGDWVFKLDSDEIILEWENVRETLENSTEKAYRVCWHLFKPYAAVPNAKFYRKSATLHQDKNHREIFDKDGWIDVPRCPIIHIVYDHMPEADTKKARADMIKYEDENFKYEQSERNNQSK
jgi:hypothetical protein